jgi:aldehyde:ferredoxin oxidoreductase
MKQYAWKGSILKIDLSKSKIAKLDLPRDLAKDYIGCRGLNSKILYDEVKAGVDPLGPGNVLIWGAGPLEGTPVGMGRFSATTKSPRMTIAEGGLGGFFSPELKFAGYDHLVVRGQSRKPVYIWIDDGLVEVRDADHIWGKTTWETDKILKQELGDQNIQICYIGPAAENMVHAAPLISGLTHAGCRAGFGEVMASKKLKAVAVRGSGGVQVANPREFERLFMELYTYFDPDKCMDRYYLTQLTGPQHASIQSFEGNLQTRNSQELSFEYAHEISGEKYLENYVERPRACFSCHVASFCRGAKWYEVKDGPYAGTNGGGLWNMIALGALMAVHSIPAILKANTLCNQLGLDMFHVAYSIAWAMECYEKGIINRNITDGIELTFGNHQAVIEMITKIAYRDGFGSILADGVDKASQRIGNGSERFALTIKGQELDTMPLRNLYIAALGVATSETGPDHTRWYPPQPPNPRIVPPEARREMHFDLDLEKAFQTKLPEGKGFFLKWLTDSRAVLESLPTCQTMYRGKYQIDMRLWADILTAATGENFTLQGVMLIGERIINIERSFNIREGFTRKDDTIPIRMQTEPVPAHHYGPLKPEDLNYMLDEYYQARGWDKKTSIPTKQKLQELSLAGVIKDFEQLRIEVQ